MNEPNIVILAGGISSRMRSASPSSELIAPILSKEAQHKSKSMLSVGGSSRPFLDYLLLNIESAGYRDVVIIVRDRDLSIREYYESMGRSKQFPSLQFSYVIQRIPDGRTKPLGTADALLVALDAKPEWHRQQLTVCNSDNLYSVDALRLLLEDPHEQAMIDYDRDALKFASSRIERFAVIRKAQDGFLIDIVEKPSPDQIDSARSSDGRVGVSMNIFRLAYDRIRPYLESVPLHPARYEKELPEAIRLMVHDHPRSMWTIPLAEHVIDLTSQTDIAIVQEYLQKEFPNF